MGPCWAPRCGQQGTEWSHESADGSSRPSAKTQTSAEHPRRGRPSPGDSYANGLFSITSSDGQSLSFHYVGERLMAVRHDSTGNGLSSVATVMTISGGCGVDLALTNPDGTGVGLQHRLQLLGRQPAAEGTEPDRWQLAVLHLRAGCPGRFRCTPSPTRKVRPPPWDYLDAFTTRVRDAPGRGHLVPS